MRTTGMHTLGSRSMAANMQIDFSTASLNMEIEGR